MTITITRTAQWYNPVTAVSDTGNFARELKSIVFYNDSNPELLKINGGWFTYPSNNNIYEDFDIEGSFRRKVKNWKENYVCGDTLYLYMTPEIGPEKLMSESVCGAYYGRSVKFTIAGHEILTGTSPWRYEEKPIASKLKEIRAKIKSKIWVDVYEDKIPELYQLLKEELQ